VIASSSERGLFWDDEEIVNSFSSASASFSSALAIFIFCSMICLAFSICSRSVCSSSLI
jgi:hypothetical protein